MSLVNDTRDHPAHVKFVSYTGKWPSLCHGILTLEINGIRHTFGTKGMFAAKLPNGREPDFETFWSTGGRCPMPPDDIILGEWKIDISKLPEQFRQYAEEIDAVINSNIEHGCCGGCR